MKIDINDLKQLIKEHFDMRIVVDENTGYVGAELLIDGEDVITSEFVDVKGEIETVRNRYF